MKHSRIAALAAALAFTVGAPVGAEAHQGSPHAVAAKSCSAGFKHASLPWGHKCLRRGQFCKTSGDRSYHRYGFHCHTGRLR